MASTERRIEAEGEARRRRPVTPSGLASRSHDDAQDTGSASEAGGDAVVGGPGWRASAGRSAGVTRSATVAEWAFIAGLQLVLELASIRPILAANRAVGIEPALGHVAFAATVDLSLWLMMTPFIFAVLDRLPLAPPRLALNLVGWALLGTVAAAVQAWMVRQLWLAGAAWSDGARHVLASPLFSFRYLFETNAQPVVLLMLSYAVLLRVHRARRERKLAMQLERSLASARIHALSLQLQPHFLFNTLNAIAALVPEDPAVAETMLVHLSDLLRLTLDADIRGDISVRTELARVDMYVALQRMRFGNRLSVVTQSDPEALDARVPAFLLQPLVENAISHGVEPRRGTGHIQIEARVAADRLILSVRDDGVGLPPIGQRRERVGIGGTRARLESMFPGAHRLELRAVEPRGTVVTVIVPRQSATRDPNG